MSIARHAKSLPVLLLALTVLQNRAATGKLSLHALSSRPDMVSGGNVLLEITGPPAVLASQNLGVFLNGYNVRQAFRRGQTGTSLIGRIDGLTEGKNGVEVRLGNQSQLQLALVNHSITGPVFSGPQQRPFICQTNAAGLDAPLDPNCTAKTVVTYFYKSSEPSPPRIGERGIAPGALPGGLKLYDPSGTQPSDIARTTTTEGKTVDYIVRLERGTINRAIYEIAFLHAPGQPLPDPWTRIPSWNGRLVYSFGGGCSAGYRQGGAPGILADVNLASGYAVAGSSLNVFGNNCDDIISAETMMMVKEYFIEQFGVPIHTIGSGASGGAMQQYLIAQNYPGLLDGITPSLSFPDVVTVISDAVDCSLLAQAFESSTQPWSEEQKTAVSGFATWRTCSQSWNRTFSPVVVMAKSCHPLVPKSAVYDSGTNRTGVRCDLYDNQVNVFGRNAQTGFARRPLDNVGVQYGLQAFDGGKISATQFMELNEKIGGFNEDGNIVPVRTTADPVALRIAYESGRVNAALGGLPYTPIIDYRPYTDSTGDIHDSLRSFVMRSRLITANGNADNQVILRMPGGPAVVPFDAVREMDLWLDRITRDDSKDSLPIKVVRNKPNEIADACWVETGEKVAERAEYASRGVCNRLYPPNGNPRIAAGAPLTDDILKCSLKPIDPGDYKQPLTPNELSRLKAIFPEGVCDYGKPGVGQRPLSGTWKKY